MSDAKKEKNCVKFCILDDFAKRLLLQVKSTDKIDQEDFPKVAVLKHSLKGAISSSFRRAPYI